MEQLQREVPTGVVQGTTSRGGRTWSTPSSPTSRPPARSAPRCASSTRAHRGRRVGRRRRRARAGGRGPPTPCRSCTAAPRVPPRCAPTCWRTAGWLDLEAPVAEYWPEFATNGKERATVRMMLDHSVGVPVLRGPVEPGELYDWDRMVARLEAEAPFWEPGTRNGYHMINFGWTVGELVRRVSGRSLGTFFQRRDRRARSASTSGSACPRSSSPAWRRWPRTCARRASGCRPSPSTW